MASRTKSQDPAKTGPSDDVVEGEVVEPSASEESSDAQELEAFRASLASQGSLEQMMDWCVERSALTEVDQWAVMEAEVKRIMSGEDAATVLAESKPLSGKDFVNKPFRIDGFTLTQTDFADGWPFYANINATIDRDGTTAVINCGGPKVIAALMRLDQIDALPCFAMLKGSQTKKGFTVLSLVMPGAF